MFSPHNPMMKATFSPRIFRSPWAEPIWKDTEGTDVATSLKAHPEEFFRKISAEGFNGIWINALFRSLVPSSLYPAVKPDRLEVLKRLVDRAGKFGVKAYLLLHEPRSPRENDPFWKKHTDVKGQPFSLEYVTGCADDHYPGLCSSTPAVQEFLEQSSYRLFRQVPHLGGVLLVTASESHTHCYSHYPIAQKHFAEPDMEAWSKARFVCPRCRPRRPVDVVAEIIALISRSVKRASPDALVMVHTWSWNILEPDPQKVLISLLPKDVVLFSDWERGGSKMIGGRKYPVDEYSYSYDGPSPRFRQQCRLAKRRSLRMMAKLSINGTHEMRAIPYLPVPYCLARKMQRMKRIGVDGFEGFAPFGGEITPMTQLAGVMSQFPQPSPDRAVRLIAGREYGKDHAAVVCRAWRIFSRAWRHYPFGIPLLYWGPVNYATAYPLKMPMKKVGRIGSWLPLPRDRKGHLAVGDNLESWIHGMSSRIVITALGRLLKEWRPGVLILEGALAAGGDRKAPALRKEWGLARHIQLSLQSTVNIIRFIEVNRRMAPSSGAVDVHYRKLKSILLEELLTAREDRKLVAADPRLGYHPEAHENLFQVKDLDHKIRICASLICRFDVIH
jgi:hypothetical protein